MLAYIPYMDPMGNKPPNWEWFIPPLKIVMTGGWFIIVLPTVFMIYFRTYRPIILNRQIHEQIWLRYLVIRWSMGSRDSWPLFDIL